MDPASPSVLIVDDDELVLERLKTRLSAAGYAVRTAASGSQALRCLETSHASIVISDVSMPDMDGLELCRQIRDRRWRGHVHVVLHSNYDQESDVIAGLDAGADDYVSKNASGAHLLARLRTVNRVLALEQSLKAAASHQV